MHTLKNAVVNRPVITTTSSLGFSFIGSGLVRPECVLTHESGLLFAADWQGTGGIAVIDAGGAVSRIMAQRDLTDPLRPNGIAFEPGGAFLIAHLGAESGGLFRLHPDGTVETVLTEVGGQPLPPCNFPLIDRKGRVWLTVSTRVRPRANDYRREACTGFIVLVDGAGARIVADGLGYANECALSADGRTLFVNETFARRLTRFSVAEDGTLEDRGIVATFGEGTFPDGVALDRNGGLWVTSIVSNRIIRVEPSGTQRILFEDSLAPHLDAVEAAYREDRMGRAHLDTRPGTVFGHISSLVFGGPGRRRAFVGTLLDDRIAAFDAGIEGIPPVNHAAELGETLRTKV
jgi:sugar lactone lactonase YvrE